MIKLDIETLEGCEVDIQRLYHFEQVIAIKCKCTNLETCKRIRDYLSNQKGGENK